MGALATGQRPLRQRQQLADQPLEAAAVHRAQAERDLEDLLEEVLRRRAPTQPAGAVAAGRELRLEVVLERAQEPAWVDADDDHEEVEREQQVDGLEHLDDAVGGAAVEVVDVEDDALDVGSGAVAVAQPAAEVAEVAPHGREQAHPLAVVGRGRALGEVVVHDPSGRDPRELVVGGVALGPRRGQRLALLPALGLDAVLDLLAPRGQRLLGVEQRLDRAGDAGHGGERGQDRLPLQAEREDRGHEQHGERDERERAVALRALAR